MLGTEILARPRKEAEDILRQMRQKYHLTITKHKQKMFAADENRLYVVRVLAMPDGSWQVTLAAKMVKMMIRL